MSTKAEGTFGPVSIPVAGVPLDVVRMMASCTPEERIQIREMLRIDDGEDRTEVTLETDACPFLEDPWHLPGLDSLCKLGARK